MRFSNSDCCSCVAPPDWEELRCRTYPLLFLRGTSGVGGAELPYSTYPLLFLRGTSGVGGAEICPTPPPWLNLDFMAGDSFRLKLSLSRKLKKEPLWARNTVKKGNTTVWESTTVRKDHCAKGPLCERTIVWKDHCAKGPLCERTIVRKDHCVKGPLCERTIVWKEPWEKGTPCERTGVSNLKCSVVLRGKFSETNGPAWEISYTVFLYFYPKTRIENCLYCMQFSEREKANLSWQCLLMDIALCLYLIEIMYELNLLIHNCSNSLY